MTRIRRGKRLAPDHSDPHLSAALPSWVAGLLFETDLSCLIREHRPDLALVTLPNSEASAAIEQLAVAGVHVLVDKPLARTAAEAERAVSAARVAGVKVTVGLTRRYGRGWQDAAALIASGRLGRLHSSEAIFVASSVAVRDPSNLIFDRAAMGGEVLHWLRVHDLDLLLWLTGEPIVEVQAMAGTLGSDQIDVEDVISMAIRCWAARSAQCITPTHSRESAARDTWHCVERAPQFGFSRTALVPGWDPETPSIRSSLNRRPMRRARCRDTARLARPSSMIYSERSRMTVTRWRPASTWSKRWA
jgi:hypothetical protein